MTKYEYEIHVRNEAQKKYNYSSDESKIRALIDKRKFLALTTADMIKFSQPKEFLEYKKCWRKRFNRDKKLGRYIDSDATKTTRFLAE